MGNQRGYSIWRRGKTGSWFVTWTDGRGQRHTKKASEVKAVAHEIGRTLAAQSDRVRHGVVSAGEEAARAAGVEAITSHVEAFRKALKARGNTNKHADQTANRILELFKLGKVSKLVEFNDARCDDGLSAITERETAQTARHYYTAIRSFVRWCLETDRLLKNPIAAVKRPKAAGKTFTRMPLSAAQVQAIFAATETRNCRSPFKNADRAMFYRVLAFTGLRRSEAASLTLESFDLDSLTITVEASYSKRRRRDSQPIRSDFAALLRPWLANKAAGEPVFQITAHTNIERLFSRDCKAAGIEPAEGQVLGVHSFRRFYITSVVRAAGLAVGQDLARHSTPALTKEYTDLEIADYQRGLNGLPAAVPEQGKVRKSG